MSTLTDCALRNVNATTVAASRHPDHHPLVTPAFPGFRQGFRLLAGFLFLRLRLAACPADCLHPADSLCRISEIPSGRLRRPLHEAGQTPRRKVTDKRNS